MFEDQLSVDVFLFLTTSQTLVSEPMYFVVTDPNIFPEPFAFRPERWLESKEELQKFRSFTFGRGARSFLVIN